MGKSTINGHFQWLYMVLMSLHFIDSGYPLVKEHSYWKSPFVMGKLTISMAIFHSYFDITRSGIPYFDRLGRKWPAWRPRLRGLPTSERRRMGREVSVSPSGALELQQLGCMGNMYIYIYWLVVWNIFLFFHILGIIIPTDFHIFQRGSYTTNQYIYIYMQSTVRQQHV